MIDPSYWAVLDEVQTTTQAARLTGYSPQHVRLLADTGRIVARRERAGWLISMPSLRAYAAQQKRKRY